MDAYREADRARHRDDRRRYPFRLLRLQVAIRGWSLIIPLIAQQKNLARLLTWTGPGWRRPYVGLGAETIWRCCHRAVRRPILMRDRPCLREGLLLNRYLVMAGFAPSLHFGVDKLSLADPQVRAHCWIKLGERVFNPPTPTMIEIHQHTSCQNVADGADQLRGKVAGKASDATSL